MSRCTPDPIVLFIFVSPLYFWALVLFHFLNEEAWFRLKKIYLSRQQFAIKLELWDLLYNVDLCYVSWCFLNSWRGRGLLYPSGQICFKTSYLYICYVKYDYSMSSFILWFHAYTDCTSRIDIETYRKDPYIHSKKLFFFNHRSI